jgi:hypothetical protein
MVLPSGRPGSTKNLRGGNGGATAVTDHADDASDTACQGGLRVAAARQR